jgi:hypothetical protein
MNFFLANAWRASLSMETNGTYSLPLTRNLFKNRKKKREQYFALCSWPFRKLLGTLLWLRF